MPLSTWLIYFATVLVVSATPGPNMLLAMTHGIRFGLRRTTPTLLGLLLALALIMGLSAAGLGALLVTSEWLFGLVKYAGAAYLLWLGIKTWRSQPQALAEGEAEAQAGSGWAGFRTGFLVAMSNPKAIVFFTALFPQFMDPAQPQGPQLLILAATFFVIETSWQCAYAAGGARLKAWLNSPSRLKLMNRVAGGSFIAAGVALTRASSQAHA